MKIQNNKTKTATTIIAAVMMGFILISPTAVIPSAHAQKNQSSSCASLMTQRIHTISHSMDTQKELSLASGNEVLKTKIGSYKPVFNSVFDEWTYEPDCTSLKLENVNVVFALENSTGGFVRYLIVRENPTLTSVVNVTEQSGKTRYSGNGIWSGYEIAANSNANTEVTEATNDWSAFSVGKPSIGCPGSGNYCDLASWAGLEYDTGATPPSSSNSSTTALVQGGTDQNFTCNPSCSSVNNSMWYEFLPYPAIYCNGITLTSGDSISADVTNEDQSNTSNQGKYDITITDSSSNPVQVCSETGADFSSTMPVAYYGVYVIEADEYNSALTTLATFPDFSMTGTYVYNGGTQSITTNNVAYAQDNIINSQTDTSVTSISSGQFTQHYISSN